MVNYANGKIYEIICNITGERYIGSTVNTLSRRLAHHRSQMNGKSKRVCNSKQIIERGDFYINLLHLAPCSCNEELRKLERIQYDLLPNINYFRPYTTEEEKKEQIKKCGKEHRLKNKYQIIEKKKNYYLENKEKVSERAKNYRLENKGKISEQRKEQYKRKKELKLMGSEDIKI